MKAGKSEQAWEKVEHLLMIILLAAAPLLMYRYHMYAYHDNEVPFE